jgi:ribosomal protein S21
MKGLFNRHRVSRTRRTSMGVRIVVGEDEPIGLALRRLKKQLQRTGATWEARRRTYHQAATQKRRKKRFKKRFKGRLATLVAQCEGVQPVASLAEAKMKFRERTGKP